MNLESITDQVRDQLKDLHPDRIIIFGSCADGENGPDSDLDLLVVLPDNQFPKSFRERMQLTHQVRSRLKGLQESCAIDLLVFTRPQWERFVEKRSSFSLEVQSRGLRIA